MPLKNSSTEFGTVTKSFHWGIALIVICLLAVGLLMDEIPNTQAALKVTTYNLHKSFGITVLVLMFCRIIWHIISKKPAPVETLKEWEKKASAALHHSLYLLLIAMPLSGWIMSSAFGRSVSFFGLVTLPDLVTKDPSPKMEHAKFLREIHGDIGDIIMVVLALHIAAALKHHFIAKDTVLKRMLPLLAFLTLLVSATPAAAVTQWNLIHEKSSITFRPKQLGTEFKGTFDTFSAQIAFDPDNLAASKASIDVQIGTAHTGASDRDENLKSADWFDVTKFPDAKFETTAFHKTGKDTYMAEGTLTIRDVALPVTLPFTLTIAPPDAGKVIATMDGHVTLDRSKFKIGLGQWVDTSIIANEVPVDIHVTAIAAAPVK